jgi:hypothetical protein
VQEEAAPERHTPAWLVNAQHNWVRPASKETATPPHRSSLARHGQRKTHSEKSLWDFRPRRRTMDSDLRWDESAIQPEGGCPVDADRFDDLLRSLTETSSRRGVARALTGLMLVGPLSLLPGCGDMLAKKKHKKKKCKSCSACQTCKKGKCKPKPEGADCGGNKVCQSGQCVCPTACCSNDDCGTGGACVNDACQCLNGFQECRGACIPAANCCTDEDCSNPRVCDGGECVCPTGQKDCSGTCIPQDACCDADCESTGGRCLDNDSCATTCDPSQFPDTCPSPCFCEAGPRVCLASVPADQCGFPPCDDDAACPSGSVCILIQCAQMPDVFERHCAALC